MTYNAYGTMSGSGYGITLSTNSGETRPTTPSGLVVTQAVQTREGWLGQVIVDKRIVWESDVHRDGEDAIQAANARVVEVFRTLFSSDPPAEG